ncbi:hypothetical protein [Methanobrevibacter sp.]|uniref:hypothetical protein n=1 Tax=Methanobrevibacter sp. TaxID=66852 RepID=UPI003D7CFB6A
MTDNKIEELIEKQVQRENAIKEVKEDYINDIETQRKQITVKLFPNTHKKLKVIAASKDSSLEKVATSIIEDKVADIDIAKYVEDAFKDVNEDDWFKRKDIDNSTYDINDKLLNKGNPRKRINVKVDLETHMKLRIISAIQDRSLDKLVGSVIEYEIGEENNINTSELMDEILKSIE